MFKEYFNESKQLITEARKLDFKTVYIFISVAVIIFISISFASPSTFSGLFRDSYENFYVNPQYIFDSRVYWFLTDGLIMFLIPVLSIKFILKGNLRDYGFTLGDKKFGFFTMFLFLIVMLPVLWIVSASPDFARTYPQGGSLVSESIYRFLFYQFCILIYMLGWEFLWRGYMLFGLKPKFGYYTIFIQMIPFFILHKGKPELELFASIFAGIILGIQALRSGSFIYAWILHWLVMFFIDSISIFREHYQFFKLF